MDCDLTEELGSVLRRAIHRRKHNPSVLKVPSKHGYLAGTQATSPTSKLDLKGQVVVSPQAQGFIIQNNHI
jgi:hypothetical protein